jgi:hypothetical protein
MAEHTHTWTIITYLLGGNSLDPEMVRAIDTLGTAGLPRDVAVTLQYDPLIPTLPAVRYSVPPRAAVSQAWRYSEPDIARFSSLDLGAVPIERVKGVSTNVHGEHGEADPRALAEFIRSSVEAFPSRYRMLILSGHSGGSDGDLLIDRSPLKRRQPGSFSVRSLCAAFEEANEIAASEVAGEEPLIHVLGLANSLMTTLEVAYELSPYAQFLVGSQGFAPNAGWPYAHLLESLKARSEKTHPHTIDPERLTRYVVEDSLAFYEPYMPATISLDMGGFELKKLGALAQAVRRLADRLVDHLDDGALQNMIALAHWRAQSFKREQYIDLWDFCNELRLQFNGADRWGIAGHCLAVLGAIDAVVGAVAGDIPETPAERGRQGSRGPRFQHAHGLSVYCPWSPAALCGRSYFQEYQMLEFPGDAHWTKFLNAYLLKTKRDAAFEDVTPPIRTPPAGAATAVCKAGGTGGES